MKNLRKIKKVFAVLGVTTSMLFINGCSGEKTLAVDVGKQAASENDNAEKKAVSDSAKHQPVQIKTSPDKYTWYIKDYVGKNVAAFGYTSLDGNRRDTYGGGTLKVVLVNDDGNYIDVSNDEDLKNYVVTSQNVEPNTELKFTFQKDESGKEYDNLVDYQNIDEVVLYVTKVGSKSTSKELTKINSSPDKYTWYVKDYVGRNLKACGYVALNGSFRDAYGYGTVGFVITPDDGSYVEIGEGETLKNYIVVGQSVEPNSEIKLEFMKDNNGQEYDNLVNSQNINEIELYVSPIEATGTATQAVESGTTETPAPEAEVNTTSNEEVSPEFKAAMDSYETFFNEYAEFMRKYVESGNAASMFQDYTNYLTRYADTMEKLDEINEDELSGADLQYYIEVHGRIMTKLAEVVQ